MRVRILRGTLSLLFVCMGLAVVPAQVGQEVPGHPRELEFPRLDYDPPKGSDYRHVLGNGVVAFLVEDHDLPLVHVSLLLRAGSYLDPPGKEGLASTVGSQLRSGGTVKRRAEEYDEEADFLAADISSFIGGTSGGASANFLSKDRDAAMELFFEMLRHPAFAQERLDLYQSQRLQQIQRRNDQTSSIESREWARLLRGTDHFSTRVPTRKSMESISRQDLADFHERHYHPGNFIFAVSGDFETESMKKRLESAMRGWQVGEPSPEIPPPDHDPVPGVYLVHKAEVNQGRVSLGHLGIQRDNPDLFAVSLMNDILGGSGFTSRILNRVRSDEGLAYSAGSSFVAGVHYEGFFRASLQSKSASTAEAIQIVIDEIRRIRQEKVSEEELETVRNGAIEIFPRFFASAQAIAGTFAQDELTGRAPGFWEAYRDRLRAVTVDDVLRVARKYLHPDRLVVLVVGDAEALLQGNPDKPDYSLARIAEPGSIRRIPLPDPETMIYPDRAGRP